MQEFVISPEPFVQKCRSLARDKSLYLEVVDGNVRLGWTNEDGADFMEWEDFIGLGLTYDMLLEAISEAGGTTSMSGRYPIEDIIRQRLRKLLNAN